MTTYVLKGGEQISLPTRPLIVQYEPSGAAVPFRLVASVPNGTPIAIERQGMLVLPKLQQPTTVRVLPDGGELFPPQSLVNVVIGPDGSGPAPDYVKISLDLSGLPSEELFLLEPQGPTIRVTSLSMPNAPKLPAQAELARDVARELLGVSYVAQRAVDLTVGVDCSPSMRFFVADGSLEAALNIFAGMASVIDPNHAVEPVLCGRVATRLTAEPIDEFAAKTVAEVRTQPLATGCRSAALTTNGAKTITYLISDGIPADLRQRKDAPPHLAVLSVGSAAEPPPLPPGVVATMMPVSAGQRQRGVLWDRWAARTIVGSLLTSYPMPDRERA